MESAKPAFKKYLFVCENSREDGRDSCGAAGTKIRERLKDSVKASGLAAKIRVARTGCLDACAEGPTVLLMPDNVLFKRVADGDVPEILRAAAEGL